MTSRRRRWECPVIGPALAVITALMASALPADGIELHEHLATGDEVGRFGRIGSDPFRVLGIDAAGRVLLAASISDGRAGLFFADGETLTPLWLSGDAPGPQPDPWDAGLAPSGRVITTADSWWVPTHGVYEIAGETRRRIIGVGDRDSGNHMLCRFFGPRINDSGVAAFHATYALGEDCAGRQSDAGVYVVADGIAQRVVQGNYHDYPMLLGVSASGEVLVLVPDWDTSTTTIGAWSNGALRRIASSGDRLGDVQLRPIWTAASSPNGEVVLVADEGAHTGIFRSAEGRLVRVVASDEAPPLGTAFALLGTGDGASPALNDAGDVVFAASLRLGAASSETVQALLLYRADGTKTVLMRGGADPRFAPVDSHLSEGTGYLNAAGDAAFAIRAIGGAASAVALRRRGAELTPVLATGDPGPDGSLFAVGGMEPPFCLAADGSVAVAAESVSGRRGLVCVDDRGAHLVFQSGDLDPAGAELDDVAGRELPFDPQCAFAPGGQLLFRAVVRAPSGDGGAVAGEPVLYRAGADRIERLLAGGDVVDGMVVRRVDGPMTANAAGDVAVAITVDPAGTAIVRSAGERFETIVSPLPVTTSDGRELTDIVRLAMTDAGTVAMVGKVAGVDVDGFLYSEEGNAILRWRAGDLHVLVDADDLAGDGMPYGRVAHVVASGDLIAFLADHATTQGPHMQLAMHRRRLFVLGPTDAQPRRVFPPADTIPDTSFWRPVDLTAAGVLLLEVEARSLLLTPGQPELVEVADLNRNVYPFAVNDAGTVAALSWDGPSPGTRTGILLAGSQGGAASCPAPQPVSTQPPGPTPTATAPASAPCRGDCDGDGVVSIAELVAMVRCLLGPCLFSQTCDAGGELNISVLIQAVNNVLSGCAA